MPPLFLCTASIGECDHLTIECMIRSERATLAKKKVRCEAMLDTGATSTFIDANFARCHRLPLLPLLKQRALEMADGGKAFLTHYTEIGCAIDQHREKLVCYVAPKLDYPIILGLPWMTEHGIVPDFRSRSITLSSANCGESCLPCRHDVTVYSTKAPIMKLPVACINGLSIQPVDIHRFCDLQEPDVGEAVIFWPINTPQDCEDIKPHACHPFPVVPWPKVIMRSS